MYRNNEFNKKLAQALRKERESRNMNQTDVAVQMGITKSAIAHYESGRNNMSAAAVKEYCRALNLNIADFFTKYFG